MNTNTPTAGASSQQAVSFSVTTEERDLILQIGQRAAKVAKRNGIRYDVIDAVMDITAVHANCIKLDLERLLAADSANFGHDVFGMRRFLNRGNGMLGGHFVPRCARPQEGGQK